MGDRKSYLTAAASVKIEELEDLIEKAEAGNLHVNSTSCASILRQCGNARALKLGKRFHDYLSRHGYDKQTFVGNLLVQMYGKCCRIDDAQAAFQALHERNLFSWSILIHAYAQNQSTELEALLLLRKMDLDGVKPTSFIFGSLFSACASSNALAEGKALHDRVIGMGLECDGIVANSLLTMYGKCKCVREARDIFDKMQDRDVVSWNSMISVYAHHGHLCEAFAVLEKMEEQCVQPNEVTFVTILRACSTPEAIHEGKAVHAKVIDKGFDDNTILANTLLTMYCNCSSIEEAIVVFEKIKCKTTATWNIMIMVLIKHGKVQKAVRMFKQMDASPDQITFVSMVTACAQLQSLEESNAIHSSIMKYGFESNVILNNSLIHMYDRCGSVENARAVFLQMPMKNVVSWTVMISAYAQHEHLLDAKHAFHQMDQEGIQPNERTFVAVLSANFSSIEANTIHNRILDNGFESNFIVITALVNMYGKQGNIARAKAVFDEMYIKDTFAWTTMIKTYVEHEIFDGARHLFCRMQLDGVQPSHVTFVSILETCSEIRDLKEIDKRIVASGCDSDLSVATTLVNMYSKCGSLLDAREVFDRSSEKDIISWNAILTAYSQHKTDAEETLFLFRKMDLEGVSADAITFLCVLDSCATGEALAEGKIIHECAIQCGFELETGVSNTLVHMYGKCGKLDVARHVFNRMIQRDVYSWSAIIAAYAQHGHGEEALLLFQQMHVQGTPADEVTFVSILFVCAHAGWLEKGLNYFMTMISDHNISPIDEHYACMVDLLGRSGRLVAAENLVQSMPSKGDGFQWTSLLGSCKLHSDAEMGARAAEHLLESQPKSSSSYVLLSDIYALKESGKFAEKKKSIHQAWKMVQQ